MRKFFNYLMIVILCLVVVGTSGVEVNCAGNVSSLGKNARKYAISIYQYMISKGYTREAACAILGNANQEQGFNPGWNRDKTYYGTFQFNTKHDLANTYMDWVDKKNEAGANLVKEDCLTQFMFVDEQLLDSALKNENYIPPSNGKWNKSKFKACTDIDLAVELFCAGVERPTGGEDATTKLKTSIKYQNLKERKKWAKQFLKDKDFADFDVSNLNSADSPNKNSNSVTALTGKNQMRVIDGIYYTEDALGSLKRLDEINVEDDYLSQAVLEGLGGKEEINSLSYWKMNIDNYTEDKTILGYMRTGTQVIGILISVWAILIYVFYWFDVLNNFIDFPLLPLITFNRLYIATEMDDDNWGKQVSRGAKHITVGHRSVLQICIICIVFSVFLISGYFYLVVGNLIYKVQQLLGNIS